MLDKFNGQFPFLKNISHRHSDFYHRIEAPAGIVLIKEGHIAKKAFLIEKGCIRAWINNNGKDITFQFFFENEAVSSSESFRKDIPSFFTIETIESCVLYWIHKKDWYQIMEEISNNYLREAIIESSWVIIRKDPAMLMMYKTYCARMDENKAIIKIARHLLSRIRYVWSKETKYEKGIAA